MKTLINKILSGLILTIALQSVTTTVQAADPRQWRRRNQLLAGGTGIAGTALGLAYRFGLFSGAHDEDHTHFESDFEAPIYENGCFYNHPEESRIKHTADALNIFAKTVVSWVTTNYYPQNYENDWIVNHHPLVQSEELSVQWIGHASFLIQVNNVNILTDPVFYHLHPIIYRRKMPLGIDPEALPQIDYVIISHNHRDHLDEATMLLLLAHQPTMLVPMGMRDWFVQRGFETVHEHTWWDEKPFEKTKFTFVPAVHWSGRNGIDAHTSLWGGWMIEANGKTLYFAGDTGFHENLFAKIKNRFPDIDCALLPIGPCEPRDVMCHSHMGPDDAVEVCRVLQPKIFIPMHWGTFRLGPDPFIAPIEQLRTAWDGDGLEDVEKYEIKFGERKIIA